VVADGMGGHQGGDIASQLTVKIFSDYFSDIPLNSEDKVKVVARCIKKANEIIYQKSQTDQNLSGMGTTVVSLLIEKQIAYISNVGDSRVYLINNKQIYQLSKDHSLVQEKINLGIYSRDEACFDRMKNVLVRTLGFEDRLEVDIFEYKIHRHDIFLLCSDGLYGKVYEEDILKIVNKNIPDPANVDQRSIDQAVQELIAHANKYGGNDNISVILAVAK
jgi:protein phosphatase